MKFTNWKTTVMGVLAAIPPVLKLVKGEVLTNEDYGLIAAALGLLFAKDHNVTGGTKMQDGGTIPIIPTPKQVDHLNER